MRTICYVTKQVCLCRKWWNRKFIMFILIFMRIQIKFPVPFSVETETHYQIS
jgi:hypothetical protein